MDSPAATAIGDALTPDATIRELRIDWAALQKANILSAQEFDVITHLGSYSLDERGEEALSALLGALSKCTAIEPTQYLLLLLDDIFTGNPDKVKLVHNIANRQRNDAPYMLFLRLLNRTDAYVRGKALRVLCALLGSVEGNVSDDLLGSFVASLSGALRRSDDEAALLPALSALQILLRKAALRTRFIRDQGLQMLLPLVTAKSQNIQIVYQTLYCVWLLTFDKEARGTIFKESNIVSLVSQVLKTHQKEKVIRMGLSILRELSACEWASVQMVDQGVVKILHNLLIHKWVDEDLQHDLESLTELLNGRVAALISIEVYARELERGQLNWTPVHKSEKFWKENYTKFDSENFRMLRVLGALLFSDHARTLAVACHDLGNFSRFHPRGKTLLEEFGLKTRILQLLTHDNAEVQKEALLCVQKMLVQRWESLATSLGAGSGPIGSPVMVAGTVGGPAASAAKPAGIANPLDKAIPQGPPALRAAASPPARSAAAPAPK